MPLSSTALADLYSVFELFDKDRDGNVTREEIPLIMRAIGQTPNESELEEYFEEYALEEGQSIDLALLTKILEAKAKTKSSTEAQSLREQFRVFDRHDDGTIEMASFRYIMTNLGEKLSEDEINELLQDPSCIDPKTGLILYDNLIKIILS